MEASDISITPPVGKRRSRCDDLSGRHVDKEILYTLILLDFRRLARVGRVVKLTKLVWNCIGK
jgi:hypothetical protein